MAKRSRWRQRVAIRSGTRRRRRGVSDVVATILLLGLTITLFAAVFAFVTSFPTPPAQSNNQFQASLVSPANGSSKYIGGVRIVHLAGPVVPGTATVYVSCANSPGDSTSKPVSQGISTPNWNLGQTFTLMFSLAKAPASAGGNLTIYIISQSQLLFSVILPGTAIVAPPTIVSTWVSPSVPLIGQAFTVYASISGAYKTNSVYVNLAAVPGGPSTSQVMTQNAQGVWTYALSSGATKNGTFYGFVNASGLAGTGFTAVAGVTIVIFSSSSTVLTASPSAVPVTSSTTTVTLTGSGYASGSTVSIAYNGSLLINGTLSFACAKGELVKAGSTITPIAGSFSCTLILTKDPPGVYSFTATAYPSGQVAVAAVSRS